MSDLSSPLSDTQDAIHQVVVFSAPDDPYALRDVLMDRLGLHTTDAQIHAHAVPGLLPGRLTLEDATLLVSAIVTLGVNAATVPISEIPNFEHAEVIHHAHCLDDGLEIIELHGQPERLVAWTDIELISVGYVPLEGSRLHPVDSTTASRSAPGPNHVSRNLPTMGGLEAWIVRRNPQRGFRIDHKQMNYEFLAERKTGSATRNFRLFIEEMIAKTPHAYLTPALRAYTGDGLLRHYQFDSSDEHRRYTVFHLLLLHRIQQTQ